MQALRRCYCVCLHSVKLEALLGFVKWLLLASLNWPWGGGLVLSQPAMLLDMHLQICAQPIHKAYGIVTNTHDVVAQGCIDINQ